MRMLALGFLSLLMVGCDLFSSPTTPTSVFIAGRCTASPDSNAIRCSDSSTTEPEGRMTNIVFSLLNQQGEIVGQENVSPSGPAPRQVLFSGLNFGEFSVKHEVFADGGAKATRFYERLLVQ